MPRRFSRGAGLVALLVLYGTAVTEYDPGTPALRGLVLLLLVAAWMWLPRVAPREAALGAAAVAGIGVLSLPLAAALDGDRPWWDYRAWSWFGDGKVVTFDWSHEYGPLDWPRDGTTLLNVRADRPHYWKVQALDTFDGLRWLRAGSGSQGSEGAELAFKRLRAEGATWDYNEFNPAWNEQIGFTVRSLSTELVVGAGITYEVEGIDDVLTTRRRHHVHGARARSCERATATPCGPTHPTRRRRRCGARPTATRAA